MSIYDDQRAFDPNNFAAIDRGMEFRQLYTSKGYGDPDCEVTTVTDLIADQLRALPEDEWMHVLKTAVMHAHEEIHGWGSAEGLSLWVEGLKEINV